MKQCVRCEKSFVGSKSQVYCSPACRMAANEEAAKKRREEARRERRRVAKKRCIVCGAQLSMYGYGNTCAQHTNPKPLSDTIREIRRKII